MVHNKVFQVVRYLYDVFLPQEIRKCKRYCSAMYLCDLAIGQIPWASPTQSQGHSGDGGNNTGCTRKKKGVRLLKRAGRGQADRRWSSTSAVPRSPVRLPLSPASWPRLWPLRPATRKPWPNSAFPNPVPFCASPLLWSNSRLPVHFFLFCNRSLALKGYQVHRY